MSVGVEMAMTYSFCNPDFCQLVFPAEAGLGRAEGLGPRMSGPLPWGLALNCLLHLMGQPCPCVRASAFPSSLFFTLSLSLCVFAHSFFKCFAQLLALHYNHGATGKWS